MPDTKISALTAATFLDGAEELPLAQSGANEKATVSQVIGGAYVVLQSDYTLTSTTASQKLFNATTNGALQLTSGIYHFDAFISITGMSGTTGNGAFSIIGAGSANIATARTVMHAVGIDATTTGTPAAQGGAFVQAANAFTTNTVTAGTGTAMGVRISGVIDVTVAGTIIPSIALQTASAAVVKAGSFFRIQRIGNTATATLGNWS